MALGYLTAPLCLWGRDGVPRARLFVEVPGGTLRHMESAEVGKFRLEIRSTLSTVRTV